MGYLPRQLSRRSVLEAVVLVASLWAAYLLRFEFDIPRESVKSALFVTPIVFTLQLLALRRYNVHRVMGRYFSYDDLSAFVWAAALWLAPMLLSRALLPEGWWRIPYSVTIIDTLLVLGGMISIRIAQRFHSEMWSHRASRPEKTKPVLLVGAGEAGAKVARELARSQTDIRVVGFVDDDPVKHDAVISSVFVFGSCDDIPQLVVEHDIDHIIVTIADPRPGVMHRILDICAQVPIGARAIPSYLDIVQGTRAITSFRDVDVEDLLGRDPVILEAKAEVVELLHDKVVMVTGAGGSIGSELARQVATIGPSVLLLVERFEGALFEIHRELERTHPETTLVALLADITDEPRMRGIFGRFQPQVVVHAAAHKHVGMMEKNPAEAIKNNTIGTQLVAGLAGDHKVDCFVLVSTDKAVRPTSVMGASKRLAEKTVQQCNDLYAETKYVAVRFGNVLGSSGSVIPIFKEQVRRGGPVTVRHEDVTRYFMTIPEASRLVLMAGAIGDGGEVMVLDMGEPIRIVDLARNLIRLSGYVPDHDISIEITGLLPGEKLNEELYSDTEGMALTRHPKIFVGRANGHKTIDATVAELAAVMARGDDEELRALLSSSIADSRLALSGTANGG